MKVNNIPNMNKEMYQHQKTRIEFEMKGKKVITRVIDSETGKVIREIPENRNKIDIYV